MYILISSITFLSFILISIRHLYYSPYIYYINSSLYYYILPQRRTTFKPLHHLISYIDSMKNPYHHVIYHIDVHPSGTTTSSITHRPKFQPYHHTVIHHLHYSYSSIIFETTPLLLIVNQSITSIIYPYHHIIHYIALSYNHSQSSHSSSINHLSL